MVSYPPTAIVIVDYELPSMDVGPSKKLYLLLAGELSL